MYAKIKKIRYQKPIWVENILRKRTKLIAEIIIENEVKQVDLINIKKMLGVSRISNDLVKIIESNDYKFEIDVNPKNYKIISGSNTDKYIRYLKEERNKIHSKKYKKRI